MDKNNALRQAHKSLARTFNLSFEDVAIGFPMEKFDDAIRIVAGVNKIEKTARDYLDHAKCGAASFIVCAMPVLPLGGKELAMALTIEGVTLALSVAFYAASKSSHFLRKDRENEVKAAIEYGKTPGWIHRLALEGKL